MYKKVDPKQNFSKMEIEILEFWKKTDAFKKSISLREDREEFIFYDGPPFATGMPHFGNFVPSVLKDIIPRYKTMKGFKVERRFGWDCHGLPIEREIEKTLGISGRKEIEEYGVKNFNEQCQSIVLRFTKEWDQIISRLGRWVDFKNDYKTMDANYMESIWWVFSQLWKKDLIYKDHYILPYSTALGTPLSNFEVNLGGYKEVVDPAITIRFKVKADSKGKVLKNIYLLAWTTTPWTLPANLALCINKELTYVKILDKTDRCTYILSKSNLKKYYQNEEDYKIKEEFLGDKLFKYSYEPLFDYFKELEKDGAFVVLEDSYVSSDDGTGIVHMAPGFGEDDYRVVSKFLKNLPALCPIDDDCFFLPSVVDFAGVFVKDADKKIIQKLKNEGKLVKRENYLHNYPYCYRTDTPLIYRAVSSWFVNVTKIKEKMLLANTKINWNPKNIGHGRFGKWLENARDWAISRNRFWGNPIPVWIEDNDSGYMECISSIAELEQKSGKKLNDLHKHIVDELEWEGPNGGMMKRTSEVLDCWFESGSMPYAQEHYPFENEERFKRIFPADFIAEGLDQTRGWFYTLTILSVGLFDKPAFKNVVVNGLVMAKDGKKMSKSAGNFSDPSSVMEKFGADSLRMFLVYSSIVQAKNLNYSDEGVKEILKRTILPFWSAYGFFVTYANIDKVKPKLDSPLSNNFLDKWIISEMEGFSQRVEQELETYNIQAAIEPIFYILDQINNFYIRRSRRRFWKSENDEDKINSYNTLYKVLMKFILTTAPFMPFTTEEVYRNLREENSPESIHFCDFPKYNEELRDLELEKKIKITQLAIKLGRALRSIHNLKNRQPLSTMHIITKNKEEMEILKEMEDIIKDELNIKKVVYEEKEEELLVYKAKANFKVLGKVLGKNMKEFNALIEKLSNKDISNILNGKSLNLELANGSEFTADKSNIIIDREEKEWLKVLNEGTLTVALDTVLNEELKQEGAVRNLIRAVQNLRKESKFEVSDRINMNIRADENLKLALEKHQNYFKEETLCKNINFLEKILESNALILKDLKCEVEIEKTK